MRSIIKTLKLTLTLLTLSCILLGYSCKSTSDDKKSVQMDDVYSQLNSELGDVKKHEHEHDHPANSSVKEGTVTEVLSADRYTYLQLENEKDGKFWVAITKQAINKGDRIVFEEGLLKKNFESKEFNRMFETIYLVSRFQHLSKTGEIISQSQTSTSTSVENSGDSGKQNKTKSTTGSSGIISIETIFHNKNDYKDQEVIVSGTVVKANYNIMGKNWIHLREKESKHAHDLTITTNDQVMEGEELNFKGTIRLNKDFGAGYRYDIIMEDAIKQ